jgi:hypothetical protein
MVLHDISVEALLAGSTNSACMWISLLSAVILFMKDAYLEEFLKPVLFQYLMLQLNCEYAKGILIISMKT